MNDARDEAVQQGDWLALVDPNWRETAPEVLPPPEVILGGWRVGQDGAPGPFEPNPTYLPTDDSLPTDPIDAVLRRIAQGDNISGEDLLDVVRDAIVEICCDANDDPLTVPAPDGVPCVIVATAPLHKRRVGTGRWWPVLGRALPDLIPTAVDILLNPGSPTQFRLRTSSISPQLGDPG